MTNIFTEEYLRKAAADQVQGDFTPFNKNDIGKIKRYVKGMLGRLSDNKRINVSADFSAYGSGFASYINVKISKKDKSDTIIEQNGSRTTEKKDAILVYISLLAPYWYFGKGDWWDNYTNGEFSGGSTNFLTPESINQYNKPLWATEIEQITRLFEAFPKGYDHILNHSIQDIFPPNEVRFHANKNEENDETMANIKKEITKTLGFVANLKDLEDLMDYCLEHNELVHHEDIMRYLAIKKDDARMEKYLIKVREKLQKISDNAYSFYVQKSLKLKAEYAYSVSNVSTASAN